MINAADLGNIVAYKVKQAFIALIRTPENMDLAKN